MLKTLLKIRFQSAFVRIFSVRRKGRGNNNSKAGTAMPTGIKAVLFALLFVYVIGVVGFLFFEAFDSLYAPFASIGLNWFYYLLAFFAAFMLAFVGSIFMTQSQLYDSTDNSLLLSMPIKPGTILLSRMLFLYINNFLFSVIVLIPAALAVLINANDVGTVITSKAVVLFVLFAFLIPLFSLVLSCIFGFIIALISSRMKNKTAVSVVLSLVLMIAYMYFVGNMNNIIITLTEKAEELSAKFSSLSLLYGLGASVADADFKYFFIWVAITVVTFVIVYRLLSVSFIKIATTKKGGKKKKYVEKSLSVSSVKTAYLKKEFVHFFKSSAYILNSCMGTILLFIASVMLMFKPDLLGRIFDIGVNEEFGGYLLMFLTAGLCLSAAFNTVSAPSISLEAKNLWISQSMPVNPGDILEAKAWFHIIISEPLLFIVSVMAVFVFEGSFLLKLAAIIGPIAFSIFSGYFGVFVNLMKPKLDWINETQAIKQSASVMITMFTNWGIVGAFIILYLVLDISVEAIVFIASAILLIASFLMRRYFYGKGIARFLSIGNN